MRFASCETTEGERFAALVEGGTAIPLAGIGELGAKTPAEVLADPPLDHARAVPLDDVHLRPVVPRPGKIICLGLNYRSHVTETKRDLPEYPVLFTKFPEALVGPYDEIVKPAESSQVDYEAELAFVVGRRTRRAGETSAAALAAIAGFTVANDVTMRDYQYKTHQWLQGKTWTSSTPLGPFLVTPDEVGDPESLDIRLELGGVELQSSNTSKLLFPLATIVARLSEFVTLEPGDVVLTGTPSGVGYRRDPQVFLEPGDIVVTEIENVGRLENRVVAERETVGAGVTASKERSE